MQDIKIVRAVAEVIKANIDPSKYKKIYEEKQKQGTETPYFFIRELEVSQEKKIGEKFERSYRMNIRYVASDNEYNRYEAQASIGNQLLIILRRIQMGGITLKGRELEYQQPADHLDFFVTYTVWINKEKETVKQQQLEVKQLKKEVE